MTPRWAGLTAPFRWLIDAVDVGRHQPAVIISAILFTVAVGFLPSLPLQLMTMAGSPPGMAVQLLFQAIGLIVSLAISPVLVAGIYRLLDGAEQGRAVAVAQIGDGFRDGSWGAIVLVTVLGYVLMFAILFTMMMTMAAVAGLETLQALQAWLEQVMALQAKAQESGVPMQPDALPKPPDGLGGVILVLLAFLPLWSLVALGLGWALVSVAMRGTPPVAAILGGLRAAALNALPLFVFAAALLLPGLLVAGLFGLVMAAVVALASLLGPLVGGVVAMAMVLAFTVVFSAISYGFTLNGWRAACDGGAGPDASGDRPDIAGFEA
jgi:MFS family permease